MIKKYYYDHAKSYDFEANDKMSIEDQLAMYKRKLEIDKLHELATDAHYEEEVEEEKEVFPPISEKQLAFFRDYIKVYKDGRNELVALDKEELYHYIYKEAQDWNPNVKGNSWTWRILYDILHELDWMDYGEKEPWTPFKNNVVAYVFPEVKPTYNNDIRRVDLKKNWGDTEEELQRELKEGLNGIAEKEPKRASLT